MGMIRPALPLGQGCFEKESFLRDQVLKVPLPLLIKTKQGNVQNQVTFSSVGKVLNHTGRAYHPAFQSESGGAALCSREFTLPWPHPCPLEGSDCMFLISTAFRSVGAFK